MGNTIHQMKFYLTILLVFGCFSLNKAENGWTQWFDRDDPDGTEDHETLEWIKKENPGKVPCKEPVAIEAKLVDGRDYRESGNIIKIISPTIGLRCVNAEQKPLSNTCKDFKVRFLCKTGPGPVARWTRWLNKDKPSGYLDNETFQSFKNRGIVRNCLPI